MTPAASLDTLTKSTEVRRCSECGLDDRQMRTIPRWWCRGGYLLAIAVWAVLFVVAVLATAQRRFVTDGGFCPVAVPNAWSLTEFKSTAAGDAGARSAQQFIHDLRTVARGFYSDDRPGERYVQIGIVPDKGRTYDNSQIGWPWVVWYRTERRLYKQVLTRTGQIPLRTTSRFTPPGLPPNAAPEILDEDEVEDSFGVQLKENSKLEWKTPPEKTGGAAVTRTLYLDSLLLTLLLYALLVVLIRRVWRAWWRRRGRGRELRRSHAMAVVAALLALVWLTVGHGSGTQVTLWPSSNTVTLCDGTMHTVLDGFVNARVTVHELLDEDADPAALCKTIAHALDKCEGSASRADCPSMLLGAYPEYEFRRNSKAHGKSYYSPLVPASSLEFPSYVRVSSDNAVELVADLGQRGPRLRRRGGYYHASFTMPDGRFVKVMIINWLQNKWAFLSLFSALSVVWVLNTFGRFLAYSRRKRGLCINCKYPMPSATQKPQLADGASMSAS